MKSGTDPSKTAKRISSYTTEGVLADAAMHVTLGHAETSVIKVNPEASHFRPASNFSPRFEGRAFPPTKCPFVHSVTHESRHAYWNWWNNTRDRDPGGGDQLPDTLAGDETAPVNFPYPTENGANTTVLDPDSQRANVLSGDATYERQCQMSVAEDFTLISDADARTKQYRWVWVVPDLTKLEILTDRAHRATFYVKSAGWPHNLQYLYTGSRLAYEVPGTNGATLRLNTVSPALGKVEFILLVNERAAGAGAVIDILRRCDRLADYYWPSNDDAQSRLELDAHTFARDREPDDR